MWQLIWASFGIDDHYSPKGHNAAAQVSEGLAKPNRRPVNKT
jgi:hypothetical protein